MLAMHYAVTLPADYDMAVIRERIASKGSLMDGYPGLLFKAYLHADRQRAGHDGESNRYAAFYLWADHRSLGAFLQGPGFARLSADFGRPAVRVWWVSRLAGSADARQARWATLAFDAMSATVAGPEQANEDSLLIGSEPTTWGQVTLRLSAQRPPVIAVGQQLYELGHLSPGASLPKQGPIVFDQLFNEEK